MNGFALILGYEGFMNVINNGNFFKRFLSSFRQYKSVKFSQNV